MDPKFRRAGINAGETLLPFRHLVRDKKLFQYNPSIALKHRSLLHLLYNDIVFVESGPFGLSVFKMDNLSLPGDSCFTSSEAQKLTDRIIKLGFAVSEIRGVWVHYTHLKPSEQRNDNVSDHFHKEFGGKRRSTRSCSLIT